MHHQFSFYSETNNFVPTQNTNKKNKKGFAYKVYFYLFYKNIKKIARINLSGNKIPSGA